MPVLFVDEEDTEDKVVAEFWNNSTNNNCYDETSSP